VLEALAVLVVRLLLRLLVLQRRQVVLAVLVVLEVLAALKYSTKEITTKKFQAVPN
jgi:hypothetical protein